MKSVKKMLQSSSVVWVLLTVVGTLWGARIRAEEVKSVSSSTASGSSILTPRLQEILKTAMRVIREDEGVVTLTLPGVHSFADGSPIMFFRRKGQRIEVIASGKVITEIKNPKTGALELQVELDKDTVIKYPVEGDLGAPLTDPSAFGEGNKRGENDFLLPEEESSARENDRPGYAEFGMGLILGDLQTSSTTIVNEPKKTTLYRFQNTHWAYFSDFFPVGVTSDSHSGNFPTSTYYNRVVASRAEVSQIGIHYRFPPWFAKKLEWSARVDLLKDRFITDNTDENLLTTEVSGLGLGIRGRYSFVPVVWKPEKGRRFSLAMQAITLDASYFPTLQAQDLGVSRGTSSPGSTGFSGRLSATALTWIDYIPLFKRWVLEGSVGIRAYQLSFSGPVTLESTGFPVSFPEGTKAKEREIDFRFFVGVRIEDPIRSLFSDGNKKK